MHEKSYSGKLAIVEIIECKVLRGKMISEIVSKLDEVQRERENLGDTFVL